MNASSPIPGSMSVATRRLNAGRRSPLPLAELPVAEFLPLWFALCYRRPGFHPDDHPCDGHELDDFESSVADEAVRRHSAGRLRDEEAYPSDAQRAGIEDRARPKSRRAPTFGGRASYARS